MPAILAPALARARLCSVHPRGRGGRQLPPSPLAAGDPSIAMLPQGTTACHRPVSMPPGCLASTHALLTCTLHRPCWSEHLPAAQPRPPASLGACHRRHCFPTILMAVLLTAGDSACRYTQPACPSACLTSKSACLQQPPLSPGSSSSGGARRGPATACPACSFEGNASHADYHSGDALRACDPSALLRHQDTEPA